MSNRAPILLTDLTAVDVTGAITASGQSVIAKTTGCAAAIVQMTTAASLTGHNVSFEVSLNSTNGTDGNWISVLATRTNAATSEVASGVLTAAPAYGWRLTVGGYKWLRVRATAHTTGTANYVISRTDFPIM